MCTLARCARQLRVTHAATTACASRRATACASSLGHPFSLNQLSSGSLESLNADVHKLWSLMLACGGIHLKKRLPQFLRRINEKCSVNFGQSCDEMEAALD